MKKISILVAMMLVLTGGAFAQRKQLKELPSLEKIPHHFVKQPQTPANDVLLTIEKKVILSYNFTWQETEVVKDTDGSTTTREVTGRSSFACEVQDFDGGIFSGIAGRTFSEY